MDPIKKLIRVRGPGTSDGHGAPASGGDAVPLELVDAAARRLSMTCFTLASCASLVDGPAATRLEDAIDEVDAVIHLLRQAVFARVTRPAVTATSPAAGTGVTSAAPTGRAGPMTAGPTGRAGATSAPTSGRRCDRASGHPAGPTSPARSASPAGSGAQTEGDDGVGDGVEVDALVAGVGA